MSVLNNLGVQEPNWNDMPLPPGRSLNACRLAFAELRRTQATSMLPGSIAPQTPSPMSAPTSLKRSYAPEGPASFPRGRELLPRPSPLPGGYGQLSPIEQPPTKKKRGRPTKAEAQAKAEASIVGREAGLAPRSQAAVPSPVVQQAPPLLESPAITQITSGEVRTMPAVSGMSILSMLTPTGPNPPSLSSSSSGRRRRGRSTRSEPEGFPGPEISRGGQGYEYESPYARMAGEAVDSPARTAAMLQRDEQDPEPLQSEDTQARSTSDPDPDTT